MMIKQMPMYILKLFISKLVNMKKFPMKKMISTIQKHIDSYQLAKKLLGRSATCCHSQELTVYLESVKNLKSKK